MANVKISDLPAASTPLTGTELVPIVQSGVTSRTTTNAVIAPLAANAGSSLVGYLPSGGTATTVQTKLRETVSVKDFGADSTGLTDSTLAIQNALNSGAAKVLIPEGTYLFTTLTIPASVQEFTGDGMSSVGTYLTRATSATGAAIKWNGTDRITNAFIGHFRLDCNSQASETYGLDLSGFSYCTFENIWVRLAYLDGIYADGSITPTNKQYSNNTFINVRSNNNLRDGWRFEGGSVANTANTYIGCEGSSNAGKGYNGLYGYSNQCVGCTFQGNTGRDFYTNGNRNKYDFYTEGNAKSVELGSASFGNVFSVRSSYPLWNTFIDSGIQNSISVRGEVWPEKHIFDNLFFLNWNTSVPTNITLSGSPTLASVADTNSPANALVQATVNANFQGFIFTLDDSNTNLQNKWVSLILELDTSGVVDTLNTRVYTRDNTTLNATVGEFATETLPVTSSGTFVTLTYDVKFASTVSGTPTVIWYMGYSGVVGSNVIKIRSARIIMGQGRTASQYIGYESLPSVTTATISSAANGINIHRKTAGRFAYESSTGKMRFAIGTTPTSAWRATDGSGDLIPV